MSDSVKVALILSVAIVLATTITVSALIYFSPYQSCVRAVMDGNEEARGSAVRRDPVEFLRELELNPLERYANAAPGCLLIPR